MGKPINKITKRVLWLFLILAYILIFYLYFSLSLPIHKISVTLD